MSPSTSSPRRPSRRCRRRRRRRRTVPSCSPCAGSPSATARCKANDDITIDVPVGRDPRPARRERVRQVDPAGHRQRHRPGRRGHRRDRRRTARTASPKRAMQLGLGMAYQTMTRGRRAHRRREPVPRRARRSRPATGGWSSGPRRSCSDYQLGIARPHAHRVAVDGPAPDARGRAGPAVAAEGAVARRAHHGPRPRDVDRLHALIRTLAAAGWASCTSATGSPRCSRSRDSHHGSSATASARARSRPRRCPRPTS